MRRTLSVLIIILVSMLFTSSMLMAIEVTGSLNIQKVKPGQSISVFGRIYPGQDLFAVVCDENLFTVADVTDVKVKAKRSLQEHGFINTAIPAKYYILTTDTSALSRLKLLTIKQKQFTYKVPVRKINAWRNIDPSVRLLLGPIKSEDQWKMLIYSHEDQMGIDTITKERIGIGGNARMILSVDSSGEPMDRGVSGKLDKLTGKYVVSLRLGKNITPGTIMAMYVNGKKIDTFTIE